MKHKILRRGDGKYTVLTKYRIWPFNWFISFDEIPTLTLAKQYTKKYEEDNRKSVEVCKYDNKTGWVDND